MRNIQVNFKDVLPETSKSSAFWDMRVNSHLKLLLLFSPDEGVWTPKIDRATWPFLGLSDMRQELLKFDRATEAFLKIDRGQELFLNSTGRHYHFL